MSDGKQNQIKKNFQRYHISYRIFNDFEKKYSTVDSSNISQTLFNIYLIIFNHKHQCKCNICNM